MKFDMRRERGPLSAARLAKFNKPRQRFSIMFAMLLPAVLTEPRHFAIVPAAMTSAANIAAAICSCIIIS